MAKEPIYDAKGEQKLMATLWAADLANNPEAFVLFAFPWGKANTPLHHFNGPRTWQRQVLRDIAAHLKNNSGKLDMDALRLAVSSGRGIGKSALVGWLIIWMLTTRIGSSVIVSANSESQLKSVTWGELSKWAAMCMHAHWFEISATKLLPAQWLTEIVERDLKKGTRYWGAEGKLWSEENPDAYAGVHNHDGMMLIFDESSGIPNAIWDVGAGYFTEPILDRYWFAFSNPRRNEGYFFECFNSKRNFWNTRTIDSRTVEGTDKQIYEQIIAEHGPDSRQAKVEVYGEFPSQGDDQFIDAAQVDAAMERKAYEDPDAPTILGVDVARFGSDKTVLAIRKGRDLVLLKRYSGLDTMEVVGKVIAMIEQHAPDMVAIDEGGLGAGVVDRLKEQRFKVRGVNFGSRADAPAYGNKRAEMWGDMRDWIKTAHIPSDRELRQDFLSPTYKINSTGQVMLESKDAMKKRGLASPDSSDAVALTFAYRVARKTGAAKPMREKLRDKVSRGMLSVSANSGAWMN